MKKRMIAFFLAVLLLVTLASCGASNAGNTAGDADESITVAYSSISSGALAIWSGYPETNLKAECDSRGWELKTLSAEGNLELQSEQISQLINMDPDVMVIFPGDPRAASDWVQTVNAADIPCILIGQDVPEAARQYVAAFVGSDQYEMCWKIAEIMIEENGADAGLNVVCISGVPVQQDYIDREGGFNAAIAELTN